MASSLWMAAALPGVFLLCSGCSISHDVSVGTPEHETKSIALDKAEIVAVNLRMGVGELKIDSGTSQLMEGSFTYSTPSWKPEVDYRGGSSRGELTISQRSGNTDPKGDVKWDVKLNEQVALDIDARLGVGEAEMNLGRVHLRSLEVRMGVGEVRVDLRGTPKRSYDVRIRGGVGEAHVRLPKTVGILATAKGGIGDIRMEGLEKKGPYWVNPGHENDPVTIRVDVTGGVGEVTLVAE